MKYLDIYSYQKTPPKKSSDWKLCKLGNIVEKINEHSQKSHVPDQQLSIDEEMVVASVRISFLQYMPKKPKKLDSNCGSSVNPFHDITWGFNCTHAKQVTLMSTNFHTG